MPESAIPVVAAVVAVFTFFIAVVGGAAFWSSRPAGDRAQRVGQNGGAGYVL